jgi:hypothetical protein
MDGMEGRQWVSPLGQRVGSEEAALGWDRGIVRGRRLDACRYRIVKGGNGCRWLTDGHGLSRAATRLRDRSRTRPRGAGDGLRHLPVHSE